MNVCDICSFLNKLCNICNCMLFISFGHHLFVIFRSLGPVAQSPISTNPGLTLNKTYRVNLGLALIGL